MFYELKGFVVFFKLYTTSPFFLHSPFNLLSWLLCYPFSARDKCEGVTCGINATCGATGKCSCDKGFQGDGQRCEGTRIDFCNTELKRKKPSVKYI